MRLAGDHVVIRAGTCTQALVPGASGTPGLPITFRALPAEVSTITGAGLDPAIDLSNRSHIVLDGLRVSDVTAWLRALDTHYTVVRNCTFLRATASGSRASLKYIDATHNRILNNTIDDGNDNVQLIHSDRNLVEGNTITQARHNLFSILCGNFNVFRNNYFFNNVQKAGQLTDCEGVPSDAPVLYDATKYNLITGNAFARTGNSGNASPFAGLQFAPQRTIVRRNRFYDTVGPALDFTVYADEARFNLDNRVYNNVFFSTDFAGISIAGGTALSGNRIKNSILFKSVFVANDTRWPWYTDELTGKPVQVLTARLDGFVFERNNVLGSAPNQLYAITNGVRTSGSNPPPKTLTEWQASHPSLFVGNLETDPQFADEAAFDFHLAAGSPMIDAGVFLTTTVGAGSGTSLPVSDATWFYDGYQIPGEVGDVLQLQGQSATARVVAIDYATNTLTLDAPLTFSTGLGVALAYAGAAPDLGAYESAAPPPQLSIDDVSVTEGQSGTRTSTFTVTLAPAGSAPAAKASPAPLRKPPPAN